MFKEFTAHHILLWLKCPHQSISMQINVCMKLLHPACSSSHWFCHSTVTLNDPGRHCWCKHPHLCAVPWWQWTWTESPPRCSSHIWRAPKRHCSLHFDTQRPVSKLKRNIRHNYLLTDLFRYLIKFDSRSMKIHHLVFTYLSSDTLLQSAGVSPDWPAIENVWHIIKCITAHWRPGAG